MKGKGGFQSHYGLILSIEHFNKSNDFYEAFFQSHYGLILSVQ